jgi:D-psicose/D-tagatose/L-ribulose 3-epimerase
MMGYDEQQLASRLPIAVNTFLWHSPLTSQLLERRLPVIAEWGFDAVELPLENLDDWDPDRTGQLLTDLGLGSVVGAVFGPGRELAAADEAVVTDTARYLQRAIDVAYRQGSPLVIGPMYTSVGRTWRTVPPERRHIVTELRGQLACLAEYAGERGVRLAVEPLNRYETSLFNTAEQVMELIDELPAETIGVNLDTYHMNIEERSLDEAFHTVGSRLLHLQVCGNDRGSPGSDHLDWPAIRNSLVSIGYRGMLGIESFTADNATIATAASIWRPLAPTQDQLATDGLRFLKGWRAEWPIENGHAFDPHHSVNPTDPLTARPSIPTGRTP